MQPVDNTSIQGQNAATLISSGDKDDLTSLASYDKEKPTVIPLFVDQLEQEDSYPGLVECGPSPILGPSMNEITHRLSKTMTSQTGRSQIQGDQESIKTVPVEDDPKSNSYDEPYSTEGFRNPGWLSVLAAFLVNFVVSGTTFGWGNFQKLYLEVYAGQTDEFHIAFVGTSANAMLLSMGVFIAPILRRLGFRRTMAIGTVLCPLGLILASFATQLWHLYLSQGILFGLGGALVFSSSITIPSQWFYKNRAFATGIAISGAGFGGVALSPMAQSLMSTIGYRNALRAMGGMHFGLLCIATALAVSRYPPSVAKGKSWMLFDRSLLSWPFAFLLIFSLFVPFGFIPPFYLAPTYATHIGVDDASGSTLVSIMSATNVVCRITLGFVGDRYGRLNVLCIFTLLSGIFTMTIWQYSTSYGIFVVYCALFGATAGAFTSLTPPVVADIVGIEHIQMGANLSYFLTMFGNLLGTPVAGKLLSQYGWTAAIQFPGAMTVLAGISAGVIRFLMNPKLLAKV